MAQLKFAGVPRLRCKAGPGAHRTFIQVLRARAPRLGVLCCGAQLRPACDTQAVRGALLRGRAALAGPAGAGGLSTLLTLLRGFSGAIHRPRVFSCPRNVLGEAAPGLGMPSCCSHAWRRMSRRALLRHARRSRCRRPSRPRSQSRRVWWFSFVFHRGSPVLAGGAATHFFAPLPQKYVFHRLLARQRTPWGPEVIMRSQCPLGLLWQGCTLAALRF